MKINKLIFVLLLISISVVICNPAALAQSDFAAANAQLNATGTQNSSESERRRCVCGSTHARGLSWVDSNVPIKASLLCIHGLGLCAKGYEAFGERMLHNGIATYAMDVRGFGPKTDRGPGDKLNLNKTVLDIRDAIATIHGKNPQRPIFLVGESMGGSIAIRTAALYPDSISGLICSAPAWHIYKEQRTAFKGIFALLIHSKQRVGLAATGMIKQATEKSTLRQHWLTDEDHRLDLSSGEALAFIRFIRRTPRNATLINKMPVLVIQGLHDQLVKPSGAATLFCKFPTHNKKLVVDAAAEHIVLEEGQFSEEAFNAVLSWIESVASVNTSYATQTSVNAVILNASCLTDKDERRAQAVLRQAHVMPERTP